MSPFNEIWRAEDPNFEVYAVCNNHNPSLRRRMPKHLRIAELCAVAVDNGVVLVFDERVAAIVRVRNVLRLSLGRVESVYCDYAVCLVGEEPRSIVNVDDCTAGEYALSRATREQSNRLIDPCQQVLASSVTPVLVTCDVCCWVVYQSYLTVNKMALDCQR